MDLEIRSFWIIQVITKSNAKCPRHRKAEGDLRHRRRPCDNRGKDWRGASQQKLIIVCQPPGTRKRQRMDFPPEASE